MLIVVWEQSLNNSSEIVRYVSEYAVHHGRNFSVIRSNVWFGVLRVPKCDITVRDCKTAISYLCNGWC